MTTIGHTLAGFSLATLAARPNAGRRQHVALWLVFGGLANVPDFPLPYWGHSQYAVSHSIFVNAALVGATGVALYGVPWVRAQLGGWRMPGWAAAAWLSHLFLDSLYNHGRGLAIYWPVSDARLALPLPWFATLTFPWDQVHNLRVFAIELLFYAPLLGACIVARRIWLRPGH